jgi:pimeloyl-ACP methyl ester carboxylesterase
MSFETPTHVLILAAPAGMLDVGVWRVHVRDSGPQDAPALILLHGWGASLHTRDAWAQGLSAPDPKGDGTDARSLQMLLALMDHLGLQKASIAGHSIGGRIAWSMAARYPERVYRLVLVAPDGFSSPGFEYGKAAEGPAVLGLMRYALPKGMLRMNLEPATPTLPP